MSPAKGPRTNDSSGTNDVFIVGAGFSKAIDAQMPTLFDLERTLARHVADEDRYTRLLPPQVVRTLHDSRSPGGNLEAWLSSLAEPQPFLQESQASLNYALFRELTAYLVDQVEQLQHGSYQRAPSWFHRMMRLWHRRRPTVITFNYDTLIEQALLQLDIPGSAGAIHEAITDYLPPLAVGSRWGSPSEPSTFSLLKLHGSLDWYWLPADASGDSIRRAPMNQEPSSTTRAMLAGKDRFVIPPLSAKSSLYSLGIVKELWRRAADALAQASRIIFIGYSLPLTDLSVTALLVHAVGAQPGIWVVDRQPDPVKRRIVDLGLALGEIRVTHSVKEFVDEYETEHCHDMTWQVSAQLEAFVSVPALSPLMVQLTRSTSATVRAIDVQPRAIILTTDALHRDPTTPIPTIPADYPHAHDFQGVLDDARTSPKPIVATSIDDSSERVVLGALDPTTVRGSNAVQDWVALEGQDAPSEWPARTTS